MYPNGYTNGYPPAAPMPNGGGYYVNGIRQILNGVPAGRGRWLSNRASHPTDLEFQTMGPHRQATPHSQPGQQFHPTQMAQPHPQGPYQTIQYHQPQGGKHEAPSTLQYRQPQGVFYPPATQQPPLKPAVVQAPQRERKTLAIVDPSTGKNILDDMNNEKPDKTPTPPQSSESSASNTPAPSGTPPTKTESAVIAAQFAAEVAKKAAEKDDMDIETEHVVRTNKPSDNSSSIVIISDSRENKEKLNNSIGNKVESQLPQPAPQQAPQQLTQPPPQKQKPPASQQPQQPVQQPPQPPVQQQPQQPPPPPPSCQLPHQPAESVSPQPQPQPQQQAQTPQTQKHPDSLQKTEALGKPLATAQTEARETQPPVKAEPQPPVKQPSPKPAVVPTPSPKEKEVNPEPQSAQ
ncbi:hypothetical protein Hamer_G008934, partial [Homarus americanus]